MYAAGDWSSWLRTCFADVGSSRIRIYRIVVQRPGPQRLFRPCAAALFHTQTVRFSPGRALCSLWIVAAEFLACSIEEMISKACSSDDGITLGLDDDKKLNTTTKSGTINTQNDETPHKERPRHPLQVAAMSHLFCVRFRIRVLFPICRCHFGVFGLRTSIEAVPCGERGRGTKNQKFLVLSKTAPYGKFSERKVSSGPLTLTLKDLLTRALTFLVGKRVSRASKK